MRQGDSPKRRIGRGWLLGALALGVTLAAALFLVARLPRGFAWGEQQFSISEPRVLWGALVLPLLLLIAGRSFADLPLPLRVASAFLRVIFVISLLLGLSQVVETKESSKVCTVALLDVSESVADAAVEEGRQKLKRLADGQRENDSLTVLAFALDTQPVPFVGERGARQLPQVAQLRKTVRGGGSDLERALRSSSAFMPAGCLPRTLILSDGIETRGNADSEVGRLSSVGRVSAIPLLAAPPSDVAVLDVALPQDITVGRPFEVRVEVRATHEGSGLLRLYQGDLLNGLDPARRFEKLSGLTTFTFKSVVRVAGNVSYRAALEPGGPDRFAENNEATATFDVPGPPRVLVVDGAPAQAVYLTQALSAQQFDVELRAPDAFPASAVELEAFAFVVLSDVERAALGRNAEQLLISFVRRGGGLLYAGGAAGYGPGGWQGSDLEKILPVSMDDEKSRDTPGVALALVIDRSGSMSGLPLEMAKEACNATVSVLEGNDLLEVIAFDSKPTRYVRMQPARYRARIAGEIRRIQPGGGTDFFSSLDMAYQDLASVEARKKHIVLLTDGNAPAEGLFDLASTALADGITVTTVGLGSGLNEELLRMIAEGGGGRFHLAPDPDSLPRIFTRETELVSKQAAVEDWFPVRSTGSVDFLRGVPIESAPFLRGYTRVQLRAAPAEAVLSTDNGDTILARQRHGLGSVLAWTSDLKARWATDWLKWRSLGQFLGQLVRAHQRSDDETTLPMAVELWGDEVVARVEAYDRADRFDSGLVSTLQALGASGAVLAQPAPFVLVGPGLYEARFRLPRFGSFALLAEHRRAGPVEAGPVAARSRASVSYPYAEEFRRLDADPAALARFASAGRGSVNPTAEQLWDAGSDRITTQVSRAPFFLILALVLFVLDLLARRLRLPERRQRTQQRGVRS